MSLPLCAWTWIRVCACRCAYMSETHVDIVQRWTDMEGERSRTHEETQTLSAHHPPFFRSRLSNIWPQKGPSSVFHIERFFVHLLSPRTLGPVRRHKRGRNHKVCIFLENASVVCTCFSVPIASGWRPL